MLTNKNINLNFTSKLHMEFKVNLIVFYIKIKKIKNLKNIGRNATIINKQLIHKINKLFLTKKFLYIMRQVNLKTGNPHQIENILSNSFPYGV